MSIELEYIVGPIYREIKGWKHHCVGIDGKVYTRYKRIDGIRRLQLTNKWYECKYYKDWKGYLYTNLYDEVNTLYNIHHLVLENFDRYATFGEECRHLDGNPENNKLENLIWGWPIQNSIDRTKHGKVTKHIGEDHGRALLTKIQVDEIRRRLSMGESQVDIAKEYKVSPSTINKIYLKKNWKE